MAVFSETKPNDRNLLLLWLEGILCSDCQLKSVKLFFCDENENKTYKKILL